jgi:DNA (cytosine-5)-methyltransferase 1
MIFGSVCSGIEAASTAWEPLGWKAAWFAEIEPFPSAVLAHHWPEVPNLGDFTTIRDRIASWEVPAPEVLVGGTPCQAFSVAGLRQSMGDSRGQLTLEFVRLANGIDAARSLLGIPECIVVWENVPGVLNTPDNAFGCFLAGLAGEDDPLLPPGGRWSNAGRVLGPTRAVAWRILDAQYFGVAQRRRRVFVVASARKGFDPATVLFEWDGVRRDSAPSREAREVAPTIPARSTAGGGLGTDFDCDGGTICVATGQAGAEIGADMAPTLNCNHEAPYVAHSLRGEGFDASEDGTGRGVGAVAVGSDSLYIKGVNQGEQDASAQEADAREVLHLLREEVGEEAFAEWRSRVLDPLQRPEVLRSPLHGPGLRQAPYEEESAVDDGAPPRPEAVPSIQLRDLWENGPDRRTPQGLRLEEQLRRQSRQALPVVPPQGSPWAQVRRLTPTEAERLQGFPDGHTLIPWRGKPADQCPDGPRYKALGNSMAVPVMRWIAERIEKVLAKMAEAE